MRVVFDTNIFISAFIFPNSQAEKAIIKIINDIDLLIISKEIIDEILSVLALKFSREKEEISRLAVYISDIARIVNPQISINVLSDEPDNRIIECAISGNADFIITGDKKMLALKNYGQIKIISLKNYLEL
jgi:putative PIN family toxin of toxin-antitoxin system